MWNFKLKNRREKKINSRAKIPQNLFIITPVSFFKRRKEDRKFFIGLVLFFILKIYFFFFFHDLKSSMEMYASVKIESFILDKSNTWGFH